MPTSALFGAKKLWIVRNLWCICTDKEGGLASSDIFTNNGGYIFRDFYVFYGWPL